MPCSVQKGRDVNMQLEFLVLNQIQTLRPSVRATALGVTVPYQLPAHMQNACNFLSNVNCPLSVGHIPTYHFDFPISHIYPSIPVRVELTLLDDQNRAATCFSIDLRITS